MGVPVVQIASKSSAREYSRVFIRSSVSQDDISHPDPLGCTGSARTFVSVASKSEPIDTNETTKPFALLPECPCVYFYT